MGGKALIEAMSSKFIDGNERKLALSSLAFSLSEPASNIRAFGMRFSWGSCIIRAKACSKLQRRNIEVVQAVFENWTLFSILFNFASEDYKFGF
jgi:hypothetical protein